MARAQEVVEPNRSTGNLFAVLALALAVAVSGAPAQDSLPLIDFAQSGALERCASLAPDDETGYYKVASFYWDKAYRDPLLEDEQKDAYADKGLVAVDRAIDLKPDYVDALVYKGLLYRVKAQVTQDRVARFQYLDQAQALQEQAQALQEEQAAEAPPAPEG